MCCINEMYRPSSMEQEPVVIAAGECQVPSVGVESSLSCSLFVLDLEVELVFLVSVLLMCVDV